jgi:hypothetical protein
LHRVAALGDEQGFWMIERLLLQLEIDLEHF